MAWIEASAGGGGSTGGGNTIMVTCSDSFAGLPITCTNGLTTKTLNCPSTAPYVIQFTDVIADEWTISGTVDGTTYSTTVEVGDIFTAILESGFDYKTWVDLSQNYHSTDYNSLADVLADEDCVRELMTIHACADYLIDAVSDDIDVIDDFIDNDTAMKWIGLRDYTCDGLTAIVGVEAKFLASAYWERYLKDHVPTMTSNTAPYGTASAYQVFDGNSSTTASGTDFTYQSTNPICVKKFDCDVSGGTLQGSNDGTNFTDINEPSSNITYYMYHRVHFSSSVSPHTIQFYGRALDVSVPVMTSNTAPFGEVRSNSTYSPTNDYRPFGRSLSESNSTVYGQISNGVNIDYEFKNRIKPKMLTMKSRVGDYELYTYKVSGAQNDSFEDIPITSSPTTTISGYSCVVATLNPSKDYSTIRITPLTTSDNSAHTVSANMYWTAHAIQIYGLDYSEREFEPNTTKKWIYDHGLELESISEAVTTGGTITFGDDYITLDRNNGNASLSIATDSEIDLTNYSKLFSIVDTTKASSIERLGIGTTRTTNVTNLVATKLVTDIGSDVKDCVDISSIDTSLYPVIIANGVGAFNLKELWLEQ